eukprot:CAMPEP_0167793788 /NCGR_PEP_ID=MMETSP0111_2-20121227/13416_1 /TAXON_ID=91324 /ORGANISM="Lotharella globosa, Strain CCCM811" /LENGTH=326 /DNA_ID=CAMNT_0007687067 /DNA_START=35 /DNA_END=1013 /DNA_ORIENTATION=+
MSFGKFLDLTFYNHNLRCRAGSCPHPLHAAYVRQFVKGNMVAQFQYDAIRPFQILFTHRITYNATHQHNESVEDIEATRRGCTTMVEEFAMRVARLNDHILASVDPAAPGGEGEAEGKADGTSTATSTEEGEIVRTLTDNINQARSHVLAEIERLTSLLDTKNNTQPTKTTTTAERQQQQQEEEEEEEDEKHNEKHHNNNNHINNKARKTTKKDKHLKCTPVVRRLKRQGSIIMPLTSTTSTAKVTKSGQEFINNLRQIAKDHAWGMQPCVFTSTLPRAIHTGKAFITGRGHSQQWSALNLLDTGVCHGMKVEDIKKTLPEEYGKW